MAIISRDFFSYNRPLIFFIYGLVFFVLGLAISLQSRRHSRLTLARRLHWLALFGFLHGLHEWGDVFIPIQTIYLSTPVIDLLTALKLGFLSVSFACLFQFGIDLLRPLPGKWVRLRWLPGGILLTWSLAAFFELTMRPITEHDWCIMAGIWARYIIGFPGAALAAYALRRHAVNLIAPFNDPRTLRMLYLAALALAGYAVFGGLVAPIGPYSPVNWLSAHPHFESRFAMSIPIIRSLLGLTLTVTMIRALEIFDLEVDRKLNKMEEVEILSTERERLGRDLHDRTLQSVYAAGLLLKAAIEKLPLPQDESVVGGLNQAEQALDQAVTAIRQYITDLRAQPIRLSLNDGLTELLRDSTLSSLVETDLALDLPKDFPMSAIQVGHLLAFVREALSNVARHSHAGQVRLSAQIKNKCLSLSVIDDGRGIPLDYVAGYGLRNMRDRAKLLGGELEIQSAPGKGTRLRLLIPMEQPNEKNYYISSG